MENRTTHSKSQIKAKHARHRRNRQTQKILARALTERNNQNCINIKQIAIDSDNTNINNILDELPLRANTFLKRFLYFTLFMTYLLISLVFHNVTHIIDSNTLKRTVKAQPVVLIAEKSPTREMCNVLIRNQSVSIAEAIILPHLLFVLN